MKGTSINLTSTDSQPIALYVDLDGTLIFTDCLYESFLRLLRVNPFAVFLALGWLLKGGRAYMKAQIATQVDIDVQTLPYNAPLIEWLHDEKAKGREIILATASQIKYAEAIASHLKLFDRVLASDKDVNFKGRNKVRRLVDESTKGGFDYAGDSYADLKVWEAARAAVVVSNSNKLLRSVKALTSVEKVFPSLQKVFSLAALRPHQWLKNVLLFAPLFTSHQFLQTGPLITTFVAFISLSLCASSVYILNDLLDLEEDRQHPRKRYRPFASGKASLIGGIVALPCLLVGAFLIAARVGPDFVLWLGLYYALTLLYSFYLKRIVIVDILVLASLYTIRIIAGAAATSVPVSGWLLAFSMFLFLSLSLVKRYAELVVLAAEGLDGMIPGRNYHTRDARVIQWLGLASGYLAVLVLALYVDSSDVLKLYSNDKLLWFSVPLVLLWVSRVWWAAHRGEIYGDPVLFVVRDHFSQITLAFLVLVVVVAA